MRAGRSLRTHLEWIGYGLLFWVGVVALLVYLPLWALAEWLHEKRRTEAGGKHDKEALSPPQVMGEGKPLPNPEDEVVILPNYSPSIHSIKVFDPSHEAVQVVTLEEAESAGFTMCVRCWDGVDPVPTKTLEDLGKDGEETGDE